MQAVILTGGRGTRLAPYTTVLPKPLMPIDDVPILEIILRQLERDGFCDITLACGYLAELIQAYLINNDISSRMEIKYHHEQQPLGTAGAIGTMENLAEDFLVMNGDILTDLSYRELLEYHRRNGAALTIATTRKRVKIELGVLLIDDAGQIIGYDEKPVKEYPVSMGIYVYGARARDYIEPNKYLDFPTLALKMVEAGEKVLAYRTDAFWLDMGNKEDYEIAAAEFQKNREKFLA